MDIPNLAFLSDGSYDLIQQKAVSAAPHLTIRTTIGNPTPTSTDVADAVDFDAEISITDETGEVYLWRGEITLAPNHEGVLTSFGDSSDCWMSQHLVAFMHDGRWGWVQRSIVQSLAAGEGVESWTVVV